MLKYRIVHTKFWSDNYIASVDPLEKLLFLYFITNQYTNISGIYELPLKQIAMDTGIDRDNLEKVFLPRLAIANKIYYADGWIKVVNFQKWQNTKSVTVQKGIENEIAMVPKNVLDKLKSMEYAYPMDTVSIQPHILNRNRN